MAYPSPIGTNIVNSLSRRFIIGEVVDQIYDSVLLFFRLNRMNKKNQSGGTQIELPVNTQRFAVGGNFEGFDTLDTSPIDTVRNAAWGFRSKQVPVTIDGRSLRNNDSPESVGSVLQTQWALARDEMQELCGTGIWSDAVTDPKEIDGLQGAVDNGTVAATYGGFGARTTTNSFWQPRTGGLDTTTTTLTLTAMQTVFGSLTNGARHPTLLVSNQNNYNRYWALTQVHQRFPTQPTGSDEQLAKAGFSNLLFNNVPFAVDSHVPTSRAGTAGDHLYFLNEDYIELYVRPNMDFAMRDFQVPVNQDAMVGHLFWEGQLVVKNVRMQGVMTALTA